MVYSPFTGIVSSEPSGKTPEDILDFYSKNYSIMRRQAATPRYLLSWINYHFSIGFSERNQLIVGDWRD
jgi:hypothetical protein